MDSGPLRHEDGSAGDADYGAIGGTYSRYRQPEPAIEDARLSCSAWSFVEPAVADGYVDHLRRDLESGAWEAVHGALRRQPVFDGSLRLVIGERVAP